MPTVSYSEASTFLLCRRRHFYGYGLSLERIETSNSLAEGKLAHLVLEVFYRSILDGGDLASSYELAMAQLDLAEYTPQDRRADLRVTLQTYFANEPFLSKGYTVLAVEQEFNLEWDTETESRYPFVIDLILRDPHGQVVIVDHKTCYEFLNEDTAAMAPQIPLYIGALRALGYPADYGIYNMLRTRKIKEPTVAQQVAIMFVRPTVERVRESFRQHAEVSLELAAIKRLPIEAQSDRAYRANNQMVCNSCAFKELCIGELIGDNVELIKSSQYKERERREFATVSLEWES